MLKLIHTSDWHLGHLLHGVGRDFEQQRFLDWLLGVLVDEAVDALIIAGDIFHSGNPPATALALYYTFLVEAKRRLPKLDVVVVAGNHDSPARLEAVRPLLTPLDIRVVGGVPRGADGSVRWETLLVPLTGSSGEVEAWCGAMPYLRPADLPIVTDEQAPDQLVEGVRSLYNALTAALRQRRGEGQALVVTGHCYMVGGTLSELSERRILGGNQHALPADIFDPTVDYVALGHLHRPQRVGGVDAIRYSGAPIPLALNEAGYPHQILLAEFDQGALQRVLPIVVPRSVDILRIPAGTPATLDAIERLLAALELDPELPPEQHPFLELRVLLPQPEPALRRRVEAALEGKPVRLLKLSVFHPAKDTSDDAEPEQRLEELSPDEVFRRCYQRQYEGEPAPELWGAFHELLEALGRG